MRRSRIFFRRWQNWLGIVLGLAYISAAIAAPVLSPMDPKNPGPFKLAGSITDYVPQPPSDNALLGTTPKQYDVFHALVWGARDAIQFSLIVVAAAFLVGVFFGAIAGSAGGFLNSVMMRVADAFLAFPILAGVVFLQQLVLVTLTTFLPFFTYADWLAGRVPTENSTSLTEFFSRVDPLLVSMILFSWMSYARLTNTRVITLKQDGFVQAARALGGGPFWVLRKHLVPNAIAPAVVLASRDLGNVVILQATLTFLGLGGNSTWGNLLSLSRDWVIGPGGGVFTYWWIHIPVTLAIVFFGISWNLIGDGINEALNPTAPTMSPEG